MHILEVIQMIRARDNRASIKLIVCKIIVLLLMFGVGCLPPIGSMTPFGMKIFGIFIGAIFGWITIDLIWPSVVGTIAFGLSGAYDSMESCFAAVYGSQTALMLLGSIFACALIAKADLSSVIVSKLTNLKIAKKSPFIMSFFFFLSAFIIATLSHSIVASMLVIGLYRTMVQECENMPSQHYTNSYWLVGIALSACFGDLTFPFKPTAYGILGTYMAFTGSEISFVKYMLFFSSALFCLMILYVLVGRFILHVDMSFFQKTKFTTQTVTVSKYQKTCLIFLLLMMVALMIPSIFTSSTFPLVTLLSYLGLGGICLSSIAVMMLWHCDGKPLMSLPDLSSHFNWGIYLCISFFIPLGSFIGSESTGISATLSTIFQPVLSGLSPIVFLIAVVIFAAILTNFLNNMVVSILFISIMFSLQSYLGGINMEAATFAVVLGSYAACATPAANPCNAYIFSNTDLISFKNQLKQGCKACVMIIMFILVIYYPISSAIL